MTNNHSNIELYTKKSNEQRLKSLEEYERERQQKKSLIRNSINKSSHIKFDSDDDNNESESKIKTKKFQEKKLQLFEDQEMVDVEEHFNEKKQSKKKNKLLKLQANLTTTNDPRFQLSEQFLDEKNDQEEEEEREEEISFEEEKKKSLAILDQITNGKSSTVTAVPANQSKPKMIRFDPSKTEHKIYEIANNQEKKTQVEQIPVKSQTKPTAPLVDDKRTYEFDQSKLKSSFDKTQPSTQNGTFQFQFFNSQESVHVPTPKIIERPKVISNGKSKVFLGRPEETSSEEEDNAEEEKKPSAIDEEELKNQTFFFFDIDQRLTDGLDSFVRTEDLNNLERAWPAKRKEIAEALRTKHRKAVQRQAKQRIFKNRYRQKPHSSKSETS